MASEHAMDLLTAAEQALASNPLPPVTNQRPYGAKPIQWEELNGAPATTQTDSPKALHNESIDLRIELGRTHICREEVLKLRTGSVVPLDNAAGDPVDLCAGGRLIARGEVLVLNGNFGVRVVELLNPCTY